jgi:ribonuclease-3
MDKLYKKILYQFNDMNLLEEALTHPSIDQDKETKRNYERLELLGDAVLNLIITEILYDQFPNENEGSIVKRRSVLISSNSLVTIATQIELSNYINMTKSEEKMGGKTRKSTLENALESLIGAIYLDSKNLESVKYFIKYYWSTLIDQNNLPPEDPKSALQEWAQKQGKPIPQYSLIKTEGPAHEPLFTIAVHVVGLPQISASETSKKLAEKKAAEAMLYQINNLNI